MREMAALVRNCWSVWAEWVTEIINSWGTMMRDFFNQGLNSPASAYSGWTRRPLNSGWPTAFQFSNTNGTANASSVVIGTVNWSSKLPSQFRAGQFCDIYSRANPLNIGGNMQ